MKCDNFALVVEVKDLGELPAEAAGETAAVQPQPNEVTVQPDDAVERSALVPVEWRRVTEPASFEEFLTLEEHRDTWSRENHGGGQRRAFLRVPALGILWVDLLRHSCFAVRHLVVRFAVDHPVEGVVVVAIVDRVAHGSQRALLILRGDHGLADWMDEIGVPLRAESCSACPNLLSDLFVVLQILSDGDPPGEVLGYQAVHRL